MKSNEIPTIQLRDGTSADGLTVLATMSSLRFVLNESNGQSLISELCLLCDGGRESVPEDVAGYFDRASGLLIDPATRVPRPLVGQLLDNSLRRVPDGLTLVEPYENTPDNRLAVEIVNGIRNKNLREFLRRTGIDPDQRGGGGGRGG